MSDSWGEGEEPSSPHCFFENFWPSPVFRLQSLMAVVETLPRSGSLLKSFPFWRLHHPLIPLMAVIVVAPLLEGGSTHLAMMIIRLLLLLAVAIWCLRIFQSGKFALLQINLWKPILLYLALASASTILSPYQNQSIQWLMILGGYAVALYLFIETMVVWNCAAIIMKVLMAMGLAESVWAWTEWYSLSMARPNGSFFNANFLGGYEAAIAAGTITVLSYAPWRRLTVQSLMKRECWVPFAFVITGMTISTVLLTGSRGAMLALLCGVLIVVDFRWGWKGSVGVLGIAIMLVCAPTAFRNRLLLEHAANPETYARWQMWLSAMREMLDHPLGMGLGLYQYTYPEYAFAVEGEIARYGKVAFTPHSEYLQMGVELGVVSIPIFLWGVAKLFFETWKDFPKRLTREQRMTVVSAVGGTVAILVQAAVDSPLHEPGLVFLLIVYASILIAYRWWNQHPLKRRPISILSHRRILVLGITMLWCLLMIQVVRVGMAYSAYELGTSLSSQRENDQAVHYLSWAVRLDPGKALFHQALGAAQYQEYWRSGERAKLYTAIEELQTAIRLNPLDGRLQSILGSVYAGLLRKNLGSEIGQSTAQLESVAGEAYATASRLQPFMYSHRFEWARLLEDLGRPTEALGQYRRVVELEPNFLPARERLVHLYLQVGDRTAAEEEFHQILDRQRRFANHTYDPYSKTFLTVDPTTVERALSMKGGGT
jgi:tetratricopeptide (TPR) repeat protein